MNKYGALLMRQWKQADPERFAAIPDPERFFALKGEEVAQEIEMLATTLAGSDRPGETFVEKTTRVSSARFNAESDRMRQAMIPEPGEDEETPLPPEWRSLAWEDPSE